MKHLKFAHPTISCPECGTKQTGIIKVATAFIQFSDNSWVKEGDSYIQCMRSCGYVILGADLDDITTPIVQFPSDLRLINNYSHGQK